MILNDDTLVVKQEFGVYRDDQKLGTILKGKSDEFKFVPSGVALRGKDIQYIQKHVELANKFEASQGFRSGAVIG